MIPIAVAVLGVVPGSLETKNSNLRKNQDHRDRSIVKIG